MIDLLSPSPQMYSECDTGAGHDLSQEPRSPASLHHADYGHHAETGKSQVPLLKTRV